MAGDDNDGADYYANAFDGYEVTTVNPGGILLLSTVLVCLFFLFVCFISMPGNFWKKRKNTADKNDDVSTMYRIMDDGMVELTEKNTQDPKSLAETFVENQADENAFETIDGRSKRIWNETIQITKLGTPWMIQSLISDISSIITLMIISQYMGLRDMLCYSNVWFIIYLAFVVNDAWYNVIYKHVNVSAALYTKEGYEAGGRYIQIGVIGNILLSIPLSVLAIIYIPDICRWIGYDEEVAEISRAYTIVAVGSNLFSTTSSIIDAVLDIEGHAKHGAVYDFWSTILSTIGVFLFIIKFEPTLLELGIFNLTTEIIFGLHYFWLCGDRKGWFVAYYEGLYAPVMSMNFRQVKKVVKMTIPMTFEAMFANVEYTVFTIFAAQQGVAEAATWILTSYVWSAVGVLSTSFSSAAACHVERIISNGDMKTARLVSKQAMKVAATLASVSSILLLLLRRQFVWCFKLDETLETMLLEVIPYIAICSCFLAIGFTAMDLNDALHLYKRAMVSNALVTILIMIPIGYVMTYVLHYNIEGLASAQCIGYTAAGVVNIMFFMTADWDKAGRKANDIAALEDDGGATKADVGTNFDDYGWEDLPEEAKRAVSVLGYTQDTWENKKGPGFDFDFDLLSKEQKDAANVMGYTQESLPTSLEDDGGAVKAYGCTNYDDCGWVDLPEEAKGAVSVLGYTQDTWENKNGPRLHLDLLTNEQKAAANIMGYTQETCNDHDLAAEMTISGNAPRNFRMINSFGSGSLDYGMKKQKKKGIFSGLSPFKRSKKKDLRVKSGARIQEELKTGEKTSDEDCANPMFPATSSVV